MMIVLFVVGKFIAYVGACYLAHQLFSLRSINAAAFSLSWASVRFSIGLIAGLIILIADSQLREQFGMPDWVAYVLSFGLIRYCEWFLVFGLIKLRHGIPYSGKVHLWVLIGVAVSIFSDWVAVLTHVDQTKFFC